MFNLVDFVRESNRIEGISAGTVTEVEAHERFLANKHMSVPDLIQLVSVLEPTAQMRNAIGQDVQVGWHIPPRGGPRVHMDLATLLGDIQMEGGLDPYLSHVRYETLHPFTDGNGRSGRALWLWHMGGIEKAPLGFLHTFYYQTLAYAQLG